MSLDRAVTTPSVTVTVVICAYTIERWDDLCRAVESVRRQTISPSEIVIVIDHNPDLFEVARSNFPDLVVLPSDEIPGLAGARNTGATRATGGIVAFIDDDAIAAHDWLEQLLITYQNEDVIGVGGAIIPEWPERRPAWFPEEFDWVVGCTYLGMNRTLSRVRNLIGANMSFRRIVFTEFRFFNGLGYGNGRSLGGEETDICIRIAQRWPEALLLYQPRAQVTHCVSPNRLCWNYFHGRCFNEGLAKSILSRRIGSSDGLASEWTYTLKTLPMGVLRGIRDVVFSANTGGFIRSAAIISGFSVTLAGYIVGTASHEIPAIRRYTGIEPPPIQEFTYE